MPSSSSPSRSTPSGFPAPSVDRLAAQLDATRLSAPQGRGSFVGGFNVFSERRTTPAEDKPLPATPSSARVSSAPAVPLSLQPGHRRVYQPTPPSPVIAPLPRPPEMHPVSPAMPMPMPSMPYPQADQSLTMAYARSAPPDINTYALSPPMPQTPPYFRHQYHSSYPSSSTSTPAAAPPLVSTHVRASSTPPSPASTTGSATSGSTVQCSGTTKAGKRCNRVVKAPPLVSFFAPIASEPVERFCFQHVKDLLGPSGFYSHQPGGGWVEFGKWIPEYLHPDTQAALRVEMEKPRSAADEPGYIYAYEIRDDRTPGELKIKVGRAVKLVKRLDQWSKQCTSKEVVLRGWWPGTVEADDGTNNASLLKGRVKAGEKGPLCHRLERLVHLELADLAVHAPYLEPGFPTANAKAKKAKANGTTSAPSTPGRSPKPSKVRVLGKPCVDCGAVHKEIFTFQRVKKGSYKDAEWKDIVQPVIKRWGDFVGQYV